MDNEVIEVQESETKRSKVKAWLHEHSGQLITIFGGVCTVAGAVINLCTKKYEENEYVYTTSQNGDVYRLKAKKMPTSEQKID